MKKNLRIVSAAAAALLAVAPVAATAVSTVSAAANTQVVIVNGNAATTGDINVSSNLIASTKPNITTINNVTGQVDYSNWDGKISGTVTAAFKGQNYTFNLPAGQVSTVYSVTKNNGQITAYNEVTASNGLFHLQPGKDYYVAVDNASLNLGTANANLQNQKLYSSSNQVQFMNNNGDVTNTATVNTDQNGVTTPNVRLLVKVTPTDVTNGRSVSFFEKTSGNEVTNGTLSMTANGQHELNVAAVLGAAQAKYAAHQFEGGNHYSGATVTTTAADLTDQLKKANITVDANGNFSAPASFSFNLTAKSAANGATATLPVTVSVANAAQTPAAQETTKNVTVMHIATIYDKNGKATQEPALRAYNSVSVVTEPVTINGAKFYKLAGKDQYVKVGNIDGTKRTLSHNAYVYKSNGKAYTKKSGKKVVKTKRTKGTEVTTYGKSFMINGSQMYRVGKNQYIKKANF